MKKREMNKKIINKLTVIKKVTAFGLMLALTITCFTACGSDSGSKLQGGNTVEDTINQQIEKEAGNGTAEVTTEAVAEMTTEPVTETTTEAATENAVGDTGSDNGDTVSNGDPGSGVDVDLTKMNKDMVYSTVYQMMADAESYVGKTVKMSGAYYSSYDEATDTRYFFIIVKDATACCQQGLEFIWEDGSHVYPDEYPEDGTEAEVTGVFETYKDNPDDVYEYIRLKDASFTVIADSWEPVE